MFSFQVYSFFFFFSIGHKSRAGYRLLSTSTFLMELMVHITTFVEYHIKVRPFCISVYTWKPACLWRPLFRTRILLHGASGSYGWKQQRPEVQSCRVPPEHQSQRCHWCSGHTDPSHGPRCRIKWKNYLLSLQRGAIIPGGCAGGWFIFTLHSLWRQLL